MKGLMIFTNYFEDVEGIATVDILRRANIDLDCVSLHDNKQVLTAHQNKMLFDKSLNEVDYYNYDFLVIPGGPAVFKELHQDKLVEKIIKHYCDNKKLVCAICAAPSLIGKHGYFDNQEYTVFPGCEGPITKGIKTDKPVVVLDNFILAKSMYYANDFALEIVRRIKGDDVYNQISNSIKGII